MSVILFLASGCDDDDITAPIAEETPVLIELPGLSDFNRRAFDLQLYDGNLLVQTENTDRQILADGTTISRLRTGSRTAADAVSPALHAKVEDDAVRLEFTGIAPFSNGPRFRFPVSELGEDARLYPERIVSPIRTAALSDDNRLLLPFRREGDNRLWVAILEITYEGAPSVINVPELASLRTVAIPSSDPANQVIHQEIIPVSGGFLLTDAGVNGGGSLFRIDYDGTIEQLFVGRFLQLLKYDGQLIGIRRDRPNLIIMTADADGRNWSVRYQLSNDLNLNYRFFPTAEDLFVQTRPGGQLFVATQFTADSLRIEALDAPDLNSRTVTDLENYSGDTYVTTLSGTFIGEAERLRSSRRE